MIYLHKLGDWIRKARQGNWYGSFSDIAGTRYVKYRGSRAGKARKKVSTRASSRSVSKLSRIK